METRGPVTGDLGSTIDTLHAAVVDASAYIRPPVTAEPNVVLTAWRIIELRPGDARFLGQDIRTRDGRISSQIVGFDAQQQTGMTVSGRRYRCGGPPGSTPDADSLLWTYVLACGLEPAGVRDVTAAWQDGTAQPPAGKSPTTKEAERE